MTDLTPVLNDLLKKRNTSTARELQYSPAQINAFLREAYEINTRTTQLISYLRTIRRPYLSTAPPPRRRPHPSLPESDSSTLHLTDADRESIDAESKSALQDLHASVWQIKTAEQLRASAEAEIAAKRRERDAGGGLGRWAMGGAAPDKSEAEVREAMARETLNEHRQSVVWFLERGLEECGAYQSEMIQVRVKREIERGKSMLYKSRGAGGGGPVPVYESSSTAVALMEEDGQRTSSRGDDEQTQLLARENENMIKHYENKLDQVKTAESSLLEIAALQNTLSLSLSTQSAQLEQLITDSLSTTDNIGTGNKELKKASERKSTAKVIFWTTVIGCSFFVAWDLVI